MPPLTRAALFELVWAEPISTIAPRLGVSGVGLAKICKRANIPVPARGHWAKLRHGKRVRKPILPPAPVGSAEEVRLPEAGSRSAPAGHNLPDDIQQLINRESSATAPIHVPARLTNMHPIISQWDTEDAHGGRGPATKREHITRTEARRRRILHALFREIDVLGGSVLASDRNTFKIRLANEQLELSARERLQQVEVPLTADERRWSFNANQTSKKIYETTGLLRIRIEGYFDQPLRREWKETPERPLENRLREIVISLLVAASLARSRRVAIEERERAWALAEERRRVLEERRLRVRAELKRLDEAAHAWVRAREMREYVQAVLAQVPKRRDAPTDAVERWARWALMAADAVDPLVFDVSEETLLGLDLPKVESADE